MIHLNRIPIDQLISLLSSSLQSIAFCIQIKIADLRGDVEKILDELARLGPAFNDVDVLVGASHVVRLLAMLLDAILSHVLQREVVGNGNIGCWFL